MRTRGRTLAFILDVYVEFWLNVFAFFGSGHVVCRNSEMEDGKTRCGAPACIDHVPSLLRVDDETLSRVDSLKTNPRARETQDVVRQRAPLVLLSRLI